MLRRISRRVVMLSAARLFLLASSLSLLAVPAAWSADKPDC